MRQSARKLSTPTLPWWRLLLHWLTENRRVWWILVGVNFVGSLYGFWWYRFQLAETPKWQWLLVPDSPGSTFLFCLWLLAVLAGSDGTRGWVGALGAMAFIGNIKYGFWTASVLPEHAIWAHAWVPEDIYLSFSHAGMAVQGLLYAWRYRLSPALAWVGVAWMALQDYVDYFAWGTHPRVPDDALLGDAMWISFGLSLLGSIWLLWWSRRHFDTPLDSGLQ